jgi:hypothetical protein
LIVLFFVVGFLFHLIVALPISSLAVEEMFVEKMVVAKMVVEKTDLGRWRMISMCGRGRRA